jgi:uracil-DNA glycosylase family 4
MEFLSSVYQEYQFDKSLTATERLRDESGTFIPGSGSRVPRAVFIGSSPNSVERLHRRPLSGKTGDKFERCINDAGMLRSDVFITYIVKYQIPANRFPQVLSEQELAESLPTLRREIAILGRGGCRTIVTMGLSTLNALVGSHYQSTGSKMFLGEWTVFSIDDPRRVLSSGTPREARKLNRTLQDVGQHVNNLVD